MNVVCRCARIQTEIVSRIRATCNFANKPRTTISPPFLARAVSREKPAVFASEFNTGTTEREREERQKTNGEITGSEWKRAASKRLAGGGDE